ncbi:MAG: hypothetical protein QME85_07635 [Candidatus Saccharicenans sp.]|nr:hypothetical protein [Candidatus Saccharicenans sp.]
MLFRATLISEPAARMMMSSNRAEKNFRALDFLVAGWILILSS